jgi:hypothetical protein
MDRKKLKDFLQSLVDNAGVRKVGFPRDIDEDFIKKNGRDKGLVNIEFEPQGSRGTISFAAQK